MSQLPFRQPMNYHTSMQLGGGFWLEFITTSEQPLFTVLTDRNRADSEMVILEADNFDHARRVAKDHLKRQRGLNRLLTEIQATGDDK